KHALNTHDLDQVIVEVNERPFEAIGSMLTDLHDQVDEACVEYACTTHGDEHAKNVMVYGDSGHFDRTAWALIDYTHASKQSDWLFSIARMLYWWRFYCVLEMAKKDRDLREALRIRPIEESMQNGRLILKYDESLLEATVPKLCRTLDHQVMEYAEEVAQEFGESTQVWQ